MSKVCWECVVDELCVNLWRKYAKELGLQVEVKIIVFNDLCCLFV